LLLNRIQCYKLLDLNEGASINEIKRAYRRLALEYHPDKNTSTKDGENFKLISEAYHTLCVKNESHVKISYGTEDQTKDKNSFQDLLYSYSKIGYKYLVCTKNAYRHYLEYEPILFEHCDKIERKTSVFINRSMKFLLHNRRRSVFRVILLYLRLNTH